MVSAAFDSHGRRGRDVPGLGPPSIQTFLLVPNQFARRVKQKPIDPNDRQTDCVDQEKSLSLLEITQDIVGINTPIPRNLWLVCHGYTRRSCLVIKGLLPLLPESPPSLQHHQHQTPAATSP